MTLKTEALLRTLKWGAECLAQKEAKEIILIQEMLNAMTNSKLSLR